MVIRRVKLAFILSPKSTGLVVERLAVVSSDDSVQRRDAKCCASTPYTNLKTALFTTDSAYEFGGAYLIEADELTHFNAAHKVK